MQEGSAKADRQTSLVGSLMHLTITRPNIAFDVSLLSSFKSDPSKYHESSQGIQYIHNTRSFGIHYSSTKEDKLVDFCNSDYAKSSAPTQAV